MTTSDSLPALPPVRTAVTGAPTKVPRADGTVGPDPASAASIPVWADGHLTVYTQVWDRFGDCVWASSSWPPPTALLATMARPPGPLYPRVAPAIGDRAPLPPDYQEILWHVARQIDGSFLRAIYDKYHPKTGAAPSADERAAAAEARAAAAEARAALAEKRAALAEACAVRVGKHAAFARARALSAIMQAAARSAQVEALKTQLAARTADVPTGSD